MSRIPSVVLTVVVLTAACQPAQDGSRATPPLVPQSPVRGGRLIEGTFADAQTFAPFLGNDPATIKGITIDPLDPKSFAVKFKRVFCPALTNAFGPAAGPLPTQVYGRYTGADMTGPKVDDAPENLAPPVASGPFLFKAWKPNDQVTLDRNDSY